MMLFAPLWLAVFIFAAMLDGAHAADQPPRLFRSAAAIDISPIELASLSSVDLYCDFQGYFFICESDGNRVVKLSADGRLLATLGGFGSGIGQFNRPTALCSPDGGLNLYVLDAGNQRIVRLSNALQWIEEFPLVQIAGTGLSGEPSGMTITQGGELIVSGPRDLRLLHFGRGGKYLGEFGTGKKAAIAALSIDERDFLYALEDGGKRLYIYDNFGNQIREILLPDDFSAVAVRADSQRIYLAGNLGEIRIFDRRMEELWRSNDRPGKISKQGRHCALALDVRGRIWLIDPAQNRINGYDPVR